MLYFQIRSSPLPHTLSAIRTRESFLEAAILVTFFQSGTLMAPSRLLNKLSIFDTSQNPTPMNTFHSPFSSIHPLHFLGHTPVLDISTLWLLQAVSNHVILSLNLECAAYLLILNSSAIPSVKPFLIMNPLGSHTLCVYLSYVNIFGLFYTFVQFILIYYDFLVQNRWSKIFIGKMVNKRLFQNIWTRSKNKNNIFVAYVDPQS